MTEMLVPGGYQNKKAESQPFAPLTLDEYKALQYGDRVQFVGRDNKVYNARVSGAPKVWKTRPQDVSIPCKYGLKEHFRAEILDGNVKNPLVKPAKAESELAIAA